MNITGLEFFIEICSSGFVNARELFKIGENDAFYTIKDLQDYLGFNLFVENSTPSFDNLTANGTVFLPYSKKIIDCVSDGVLSVCDESQNSDVLIVRAPFSYGKSIILPSVSRIIDKKSFADVHINFLTYSDSSYKSDILNTHVIFHESSKNDSIFFDKRWSVRIEQGLYASEGYLKDIGNIPQAPEDLKMHSIIGRGEFFDCTSYKNTNWHLSGAHGLCELEPSIMISSQSVLIAAVDANFGVGPVVKHHHRIGYKQLVRILPEIDGPDMIIDFDVRKKIPEHLRRCVNELEREMLERLNEIGLEVIYY